MEPHTLEFGPFKLETSPDCLSRGEEEIPLRPKALSVLAYLARRSGRMVSKNELHEQIWGTAQVSDAQLRVIVREIRAALDDDAKDPCYLETVPRRGYRFRVGRDMSSGLERNAEPHVAAHDQSRQIFGRQKELEYLLNRYLRAAKGERQLVFVGGEPGIGKTTLVEEFLQRVERRPRTTGVVGRCAMSFGAGEAYGPVLDAFGRLARQTGGVELRALLSRCAPMWLVQMPALVESDSLERLQQQVQGATGERMVRELNDALDNLTYHSTLVLVLEDVHWSDVATMEVLASIVQRSERGRLMILATYRPAEMAVRAPHLRETIAELSAKGLCERLDLELLNEHDVAAYVAARLDGQVSPEVAASVFQRSGGNALFMVNVLEHLTKTRAVHREDDRWVLRDSASVLTQIPEGLRPFLKQRLDDLSAEERQSLEVAASVGADFAAAAVAAGLDGSQDRERVESCLESLASRGTLIAADGVTDWPDGTLSACYRFSHALYREELYQGIPEARRIRTHKRLGEALQSAYGPRAPELASILAQHFDRGRDYEQAATYWKLAGNQALARHGYHEAAGDLQRALDAFEKVTPRAESSRREANTANALDDGLQWELDVCTSLSTTLIATRGYSDPEVRRFNDRAAALFDQLTHPTQQLPTLYNLFAFHFVAAELQESSEFVRRISKLTAESRNVEHRLVTSNVTMQNEFLLGELAASGNACHDVMSLHDPECHGHLASSYGQEDPAVICMSFDVWRLWLIGSPDQAVVRAGEAVALAERLRQPYAAALASVFTTGVHQFRGEAAKVRREAEVLQKLTIDYGFPMLLAIGEVLDGWAVAAGGAEGLAQMEKGLDAWRSTGAYLFTPYLLGLIAETQLSFGLTDAARETLTEALAQVEKSQECWWEAELHRLEGELLVATGDSGAEVCFQRALEVARRQGARSLSLRAALSLSKLSGQGREALQQLGKLADGFAEGYDTTDLRMTRERLAHQ